MIDTEKLFRQGVRQNYKELYEYMRESRDAERRARIAVEQKLAWVQDELLQYKAANQ